ncbi:MAG: asparagine synthase (glutamine-hydrolyzing) [Candidatus Cloacimonetes bacterium]|jgi:asparagine synthase (glutamine-hydrolysing)|nr:asparagine synthase (glutamine-hydrolyzing) [Candidatus Cloacimonadota bacterium]MDD2507254.1 asparagine synthase (glutamine-hydrolyzing) [Candidatus Cloacimonadota bacterium]MDD4559981.1 asparagine synthase (glutamine-hydrolyzing) [Candidatus Cloacimonadota bacterium]
MCGIAGIVSVSNKQPIDYNILKIMTGQIVHRGPDDEGYLLFDISHKRVMAYCGKDSSAEVKEHMSECAGESIAQLGFGFRRLPTLELHESGHQPMYDEELDLAIIFNGEIYNHMHLRAELQSKGYNFFSHSDTEVIIKAYHAWGDECVHRLIGMWAFSIWDLRCQRLFMSRDRFGIKPFYYSRVGDMLYWGSEMKQLLQSPIKRDLNNAMIWRSMKVNSLLVYDDETYWHDIHVLKPGHNLIVEQGNILIKEYYHLDIAKFERSRLRFDEAKEQYHDLFLSSLKLQLRSDVPVGASLSGGMDSSAIVCSASRMLPYQLRTFSVYYDEDPLFDERSYIEIIAAHTGVQTNYISPHSDDAIAWWNHAIWLNDLPVSSGFVSQYALMQKTHQEGIKVLLSGQGSDEISGGYRHASYRYFADQLRQFRLHSFGREIGHFISKNPMKAMGDFGKILMSTFMPESTLYDLESRYYRFEPFHRDFVDEAKYEAGGKMLRRIGNIPASRLANFLYNMMHTTSLQTLLHFEDRMSMGHSVESRTPFLDHNLVEFVFSLPASYKIQPPYRKILHRKALKECVPREISSRKDKGIFGSPFYNNWFRGPLKGFVEDILYSPEFRRRGIWNLADIHNRWRGYLQGNSRDAEMLFNIISLELWFRVFGE